MNDNSLPVKTAFITGAGSGIGHSISCELDRLGYQLIISGSNRSKLEALAEKLKNKPIIDVCDLSDHHQLAELCGRIEQQYTSVNVAFINAGVVVPGEFSERSRDSIDLELDINLRSALHLIQAFIPAMKSAQQGHIVATASIGGILALQGSAVYSATKFALRGFLSALQQELRCDNIKVSGIYPGAIDTDMLRYEALNNGSALNFLSTPESTATVTKAFMRTLKNGNLETYVPYSDSIAPKLLSLVPGIIPRITPFMTKLGEKGRKRFIKRHNLK